MSGDYPAVSRWRVRHALRKAREAKGLTQTEVAERMDWSLSKVQRIELGDVAISATDLGSLLTLLGVTDPARVKSLLAHARSSRRQRWVVDSEIREHLTPAHAQLLQFEEVAESVQWFQTHVLPGNMQTPAYAEAVIRFYHPAIDNDHLRVLLDVRAQRRKATLEAGEAPHLRIVLFEPILMMDVGGADVMAEQLRDLAESARRPTADLRILPVADGLFAGLGSFGLLCLDRDTSHGELIYRELAETDRFDDDTSMVEFHRAAFAEAWTRSLPEERSIRRLVAEAARLDAENDRL